MRSWYRILLGGLAVVAVAAAGIAANFVLLGVTQEDSDPAGKLSPRAVFDRGGTTPATSGTTTPSVTEPGTATEPGTTTGGEPNDDGDTADHTRTDDSSSDDTSRRGRGDDD